MPDEPKPGNSAIISNKKLNIMQSCVIIDQSQNSLLELNEKKYVTEIIINNIITRYDVSLLTLLDALYYEKTKLRVYHFDIKFAKEIMKNEKEKEIH